VAGYELLIKPSALKELESVDSRKVRRSLVADIQFLADNPRPSGSRKLAGGDRYRLRRGAYRLVHSVDDASRTVTVFKIGHRRDVYR
jgi:mRNA interferase RelE/StbE